MANGYPKWSESNTSTVPNDPANEIKRATLGDKGLAPSVSQPAPAPPAEQTPTSSQQQTITDGDTDAVVSVLNKEVPKANMASEPWKMNPPCINPSCKSFGKPHPNCLCYGTGGQNIHESNFAKGGVIAGRFCDTNQRHNPKCEYYAEGGSIDDSQMPQYQDNPEDTMGHAAVEHGLLGLLTEVGHKKLTNPEKHIDKLKESMTNPDRDAAAEGLSGHPLGGPASANKLKPIMDRLSLPVSMQDHHPDSFRNSVDYLSSAVRGHNSLKNHANELFGDKNFSEKLEPDSDNREKLKKHLQSFQENPNNILDIGGSLGHYLPGHSASLGAHSATAINYLNSLKPVRHQNGPLDTVSPIDKTDEAKYNRALDIANNPLMALYHAKDGTLQAQDVKTLNTLYPGLHKSMVNKISEALIDAKTKGIEIPYKQRQAVSMLIGQPLDSTMTPASMRAIIKANAGAQAPQSQPKKASGKELDQINKVNALYETPLQKRQMNKKS